MAGPLPSIPANFAAQPGNGSVYLSWALVASATSYNILRGTDSVNYSTIDTSTNTNYTDTTGIIGTLYYYAIQAVNANGTGSATGPLAVTPVDLGEVSLGQIRLYAQQRADMENNDFITTPEWNSYISNSYKRLYNILVQTYGDEYYVASPFQFVTDGRYPALYPLPANFYKLLGSDLSVGASSNGWLTMRKFSFLSRNQYIYGNTPVSFLGVLNLKYRLCGDNIMFQPAPLANQTVQWWYIPKPRVLVADNDILDGIAGWEEYIIVDAAIKARIKDEADVTDLRIEKMELRKEIEAEASNRDAGEPEFVSDIRGITSNYFGGGFDGPVGGF